ncbi:MAG: methyltransferase domain-containing protein [Candidatus Wallbacteria bacterium]|nr:methyltransferase domain-containing protein [Candidatus Wallbacteria bacterium]
MAPSSPELADLISSAAEKAFARSVVEFGTGTGVFTRRIKDRLKPGTEFFTLEVNPDFCEQTRRLCPDVVVYNDSACNVRKYLEQHSLEHCDVIISGLPWAAFDSELQECLMRATIDALKPGGRFLTFAYLQGTILPSGIRFRNLLHSHFSRVRRTRIVWKNIPPAFVYYCRK